MTGQECSDLYESVAKARRKTVEGRETVTGFQTLTFFLGSKERVFTGSSLRRNLQLPTLAELEARVQGRIEETVTLMKRLLERHGLAQPDVLLRVGKASKLPVVDRVLKTAFPKVRYLAPAEAKECVVRGAATPALPGRVSSGVQISPGLDRPGHRHDGRHRPSRRRVKPRAVVVARLRLILAAA